MATAYREAPPSRVTWFYLAKDDETCETCWTCKGEFPPDQGYWIYEQEDSVACFHAGCEP